MRRKACSLGSSLVSWLASNLRPSTYPQVECGAGFTHNLEQMFKDIELAREEITSYKSMLDETQTRPSVDLNVNVLSASAWPTYPDIALQLPKNIQRATGRFENYYKSKHSGRRLVWKHALAHCQLKAKYPKGDKEIVVSSFQAIVLLHFNEKQDSESVSYAELQEASNLGKQQEPLTKKVHHLLTRALQTTPN